MIENELCSFLVITQLNFFRDGGGFISSLELGQVVSYIIKDIQTWTQTGKKNWNVVSKFKWNLLKLLHNTLFLCKKLPVREVRLILVVNSFQVMRTFGWNPTESELQVF